VATIFFRFFATTVKKSKPIF